MSSEVETRVILGGAILIDHFGFIDDYNDYYFVKKRNRKQCKTDIHEGKWRDIHFPSIIEEICFIDNIQDETQTKHVMETGNNDIVDIYNAIQTRTNQTKVSFLFDSASLIVKSQYVKIKRWALTYLHNSPVGRICRDKICELVVNQSLQFVSKYSLVVA